MTALIILNYNNSQDTLNCVKSILEHNTAEIKVVVVDNASNDGEKRNLEYALTGAFDKDFVIFSSPDDVPAVLPKYCLIECNENLGYARGNNIGIEKTYSDHEIDYIMVLNNDILFVEDIIPSLLKKYNSLPDCAILSPVLYKKGLKEFDYNCARKNIPVKALIHHNFMHYWWTLRHKSFNDVYPQLFLLQANNSSTDCIEIELPSGSCMLVSKKFMKSIGAFDPYTFLYYEENILFQKIKKANKRNYISLSEKCIHLGASTMLKLPSNLFIVKECRRSEVYYVSKYSGASPMLKAIHRFSIGFYLFCFRFQKLMKGMVN